MSKEITNSFILSLRNKKENLLDLNMEMGEIILDGMIKDETLQKVPIIKYFYTGYNVTLSIREGFLLKKISRFLFSISEIPQKEKEEFISKLEIDPKYQSKVVEKTLIMLDKIDELGKADVYAKLFKSLVAEKIDIDTYARFLHVVQQAYLEDLFALYQSHKSNAGHTQEQGSMFAGLGLVNVRPEVSSEGDLIYHYDPTKYSANLFQYGFD